MSGERDPDRLLFALGTLFILLSFALLNGPILDMRGWTLVLAAFCFGIGPVLIHAWRYYR